MNRCLSTLQPLRREGYSDRARRRLSDGRQFPSRLAIRRADVPITQIGTLARTSISGVQDKLSLRLHRGQLEPVHTGGQFLLKPIPSTPLPRFQHDVPANEHLTMQLAEQVYGVKTAANALIRMADGELAYITRRFDRDLDGQKTSQEDFCQAMGRTAASHDADYKYTSSYEELGAVLRRFCPAYTVEVETLFRQLVFIYATGNGDAHLKNFSLQPGPLGDYRLTPAYDLVNTSLHLPDAPRLAMDLFADDEEPLGPETHGFETGADFLELAKRYGMIDRRAKAIVDLTISSVPKAQELIDCSFLTDAAKAAYRATVTDRAKALTIGK